jgi:DNA repair protein RadD
MYRKFIANMHKYCPNMRVIGATGSPYRGNGVWLTAVEDAIFTDIATRVTMDELLADGYLSPLTTTPTVSKLDASGVGTQAGDYIVSQLAAAIDRPELVRAACEETVKLAADRNKLLVYCVTVEHAHHVADELQSLGVDCAVITGNTLKAERAGLIELFRAGHLRCLVSVAVLTTGFDVPDVDCIVLLRNTQSPVLYVQIMGRGMRIAEGKTDCLVLDFTDTVERLGPVNKIKGRMPRKEKGEAPVKVCDECGAINPISAKECKLCGALFPVEESDPHAAKASTALILDVGKPRIVRYEISEVRYCTHKKPCKPDSLRVEYWCGIRRVASEWVCFEHEGYARSKAEAWWAHRCDAPYTPRNVETADAWIERNGIKEPTAITINESEKYPSIISYEWAQEAIAA